jgi:hypothetical protein
MMENIVPKYLEGTTVGRVLHIMCNEYFVSPDPDFCVSSGGLGTLSAPHRAMLMVINRVNPEVLRKIKDLRFQESIFQANGDEILARRSTELLEELIRMEVGGPIGYAEKKLGIGRNFRIASEQVDPAYCGFHRGDRLFSDVFSQILQDGGVILREDFGWRFRQGFPNINEKILGDSSPFDHFMYNEIYLIEKEIRSILSQVDCEKVCEQEEKNRSLLCRRCRWLIDKRENLLGLMYLTIAERFGVMFNKVFLRKHDIITVI